MTIPISPSPLTEYRPEFLPAYLGNGVVGLRVPRIPQIDGVAILNGFSGIDGDSGAEGFARAPYPLAGDVEVNRVSLKMAPERVQLCTQSYDFGTGELRTVFDFYPRLPRAGWRERWLALYESFWGIMLIVIVLGGIYSGIFTRRRRPP